MTRQRTQKVISTTSGAQHALHPIKTNADGLVDPSFLPSLFGTAWPTSPSDGQLYFKTDESQPELFAYDSGTGDWLSVAVREFLFVSDTSAGGAQWLDIPGGGITSAGTPDYGYRVNHDLLVQEVSFIASAVAGTNFNYVLRVNGSNVAVGVTHTTSTSDAYSGAFTHEVSAGDILGMKATNTVPAKVNVVVRCRRRITP